MDVNTILLVLLVLACPLMMFFMKGHKHNNTKGVKGVYICPMHPEVQEKKEGKCPKCGMNLEPREK